MANAKFDEYSETAASNTEIDGIDIQGTASVSNFDNALREHMAHHAEFNDWADVASATTPDIGAVADYYIRITGTVTITGLGTVKEGTAKLVTFAGALTLTHNATSLKLPGNANITTAAGDIGLFVSEGSGNWKCAFFTYADRIVVGTTTTQTLTNKTLDRPTITLNQSTAPTPTAEGDIQWDTNDDTIVVGDGSSQKTFYSQDSGSFTGTLTGCTTSPTGTVEYIQQGNLVTLFIPDIQGTSNTTAATITGMPASIRPSTIARYAITRTVDNSAIGSGAAVIATSGVISLFKTVGGAAFTASGTKGHANCCISYIL